jgi:hypothetical protein
MKLSGVLYLFTRVTPLLCIAALSWMLQEQRAVVAAAFKNTDQALTACQTILAANAKNEETIRSYQRLLEACRTRAECLTRVSIKENQPNGNRN